jgi:hypothetical protein
MNLSPRAVPPGLPDRSSGLDPGHAVPPGGNMIVVARKVGQLGNRLSLFAHAIACAREHNIRLINPAFGEYAQYFRTTCRDLWCRYPPFVAGGTGRNAAESAGPSARGGATWDQDSSASGNGEHSGQAQRPAWLRELCYALVYYPVRFLAAARCTNRPFKIIRLTMDQAVDLGDRRFVEWAKRRGVVFLQGWRFRDPAAVARHAECIRGFFRPIAVHEESAARTAESARSHSDVLVGVHIRQGDYERFLGGRYYYSADQYREIMRRAARLLSPRRVSFLVCSNIPQDRRSFGDLPLTFGTGQLVEDMYALARCDYLIGPPSTFTIWASFYGGVPLCSVEMPDADIRLADFRPVMP